MKIFPIKITLNSFQLMFGFVILNCGICLYSRNTHPIYFELQEENSLNTSHSVIDNPEPVRRVNPPIEIINNTNISEINNQ